MNANANSLAAYVFDVAREYASSPDGERFHDVKSLAGTTAPTLVGALQYIRNHRPHVVLFENVVGVRKILGLLQSILEGMGYSFFASGVVDPTQFSLPNRRPRIYFGGVAKGCFPKMSTSYQADLQEQLDRIILECKQGPPTELESFLLKSDSYLRDLVRETARHPERSDSDSEWPALHDEVFENAGIARPQASDLARFVAGIPNGAVRSWFTQQRRRVQEAAYFATAREGDSAGFPEVFVDLHQSIDRMHRHEGVLMTFTAGSVPWMVRSRRCITGREMLAIHGLSLRRLTCFGSDSLLQELAGNSFSAPAFMAALLSILLACPV